MAFFTRRALRIGIIRQLPAILLMTMPGLLLAANPGTETSGETSGETAAESAAPVSEDLEKDHTAGAGALPAAVSDSRDEETEMRGLINVLNQQDLQKAIDLVRERFVVEDALSETELARAALEGILTRLSPGVQLGSLEDAQTLAPVEPLLVEELPDGILVVRPGALDETQLTAISRALTNPTVPLRALVLDLRGIAATEPLQRAADLVKLFVPKGSLLFRMANEEGSRADLFTANRDPIYTGPIVCVVDAGTRGCGEVAAALLKFYRYALITGVRSGGEAVLYEDFQLTPTRMLRIAVAEVKLPDGAGQIFPGGLEPDVKVDFQDDEARRLALERLNEMGIAAVVVEKERPRMNEAALVAGVNPELELLHADRPKEEVMIIDPLLQRAVDLATSLSFIPQ